MHLIDVELGTFTPLVMGTNGGMGGEFHVFSKRLAELLSLKRQEDYSKVMGWLRTKLSFEIVKSCLLCVRGSRRPWNNKTLGDVSSDFGLMVSEAGLAC